MEGSENPIAVCRLCGEAYTLPEDGVDGNLPRVLLCGHIYCTSCLQSIQCDSTVRCPECEVVSTLPDDGVNALQEDSRIIGLIYTAKMNKMKNIREKAKSRRRPRKITAPDADDDVEEDVLQPADVEKMKRAVDEALVKAAASLTLLEDIQETLSSGLEEQIKYERARQEMEINQAVNKALHTIQKWGEGQLNQLTKLEAHFSTSQAELCCVQERIKSLGIAMQMAREVRRVPVLEKYCTLDKVLETLQAPVDVQSFDVECVTLGSGLSCVFQSESLNQKLVLSLKMEESTPKPWSKLPLNSDQPGNSKPAWQWEEGKSRNGIPPSNNKPSRPQKQNEGSPKANSSAPRASSPPLKPRQKISLCSHSSSSDLSTPDVIVEEVMEEGKEPAHQPTGPELANDKWRIQRRKKYQMNGNRRIVTQWVVVTHIVNPSHFYVRYVAEKRENDILSKKINSICYGDSYHFTSRDTVETGSVIFVKQDGLWCRASVVEVRQSGSAEAVKSCPVIQLHSIRVFFIDMGQTRDITMHSEDCSSESLLKAVNDHLRKVSKSVNADLSQFSPQAVRCSLKDLVPYDLTKGWSEVAQVEFRSVVGSAAVEMRPLGQDGDSLLVELRKAPMDQASDVPISIRQYLVFIEVARFYSPVSLGRKPLSYYPPVYPNINKEVNAVVSHINSPADFYIQLVDSMESLLLSAKLQDCYNAATVTKDDEDLSVYCPVIEQAYVARYEDDLWYRAQVVGLPGGRKVEVRYVDFGSKKIVSVRDLRKIKDEFFSLPAMAIHCCLSEVIPADKKSWSEACIDKFIRLADQKLVTIVATEPVQKTKPMPVRLFQSGLSGPLANIAELLVREELACFRGDRRRSRKTEPSGEDSAVWDPPLDLGSPLEDVDTPDQKTPRDQNMEPLEFHPQLKLPADLKDLKVRVSHVNSPSSFYVRLSQYDAHLKRLCELVKKECALQEPDDDVVWKADMFCAAQINGVWERGRICSDFTSNNIAEVMRCDHGNKVEVNVSNLRKLPEALIGSFALECTLTDIRPAGGRSTWTATACDLISYYLTGASAVMNIKELTEEPPQPVTLFCSNRVGQFVSMADFLTSEGLALRERKPMSEDAVDQKPKEDAAPSQESEAQTVGPDGDKNQQPSVPDVTFNPPQACAPARPKPAPRTIMSAEKVKTQQYQPPELPCLGNIHISVSAIGEDGIIYVRTQNAGFQLEPLRERIQQSMKTLPRQKPYTWKSVQGCAVIGSDMLWYRGQLLEVLGGHVKVQYVDYGLVENIPVVHVHPMLLCDDVPQLCMPCQLHNINPVGDRWHNDAVALLKELLLNRCVDMRVMELPSDPRGPLTVEIFLDGMSLSQIVCHHEYATERPLSSQKGHSISPPPVLDVWDLDTEGLRDPEEPMLGPFTDPNLPQEGEHFRVRVKHLRTPNELFLWPLEGTDDDDDDDDEGDGETLDEALASINEDVESLPPLTNFPHGGPCLAEYSDGRFYRAKVIKITSVEPVMILVQHVDFGSDDTLPPSKLRQMPAELLRYPSRALKVRVAGFKAPSVKTGEGVLPYSPGWSVKATMAMMDLLHGNITASVVAREPELIVLLYNEDGQPVHLSLVKSKLAELT